MPICSWVAFCHYILHRKPNHLCVTSWCDDLEKLLLNNSNQILCLTLHGSCCLTLCVPPAGGGGCMYLFMGLGSLYFFLAASLIIAVYVCKYLVAITTCSMKAEHCYHCWTRSCKLKDFTLQLIQVVLRNTSFEMQATSTSLQPMLNNAYCLFWRITWFDGGMQR